ncbi:transmembrane protein [Cyclospora cayetanensis]|uniref:Transmembrane protein n=1 Tax=Cyclospora cayetanensis TaxID=88456 RepID=A0A1D3D2P1_9EIME|nr:transmembrane protein [Cyclospora cayetanensis]
MEKYRVFADERTGCNPFVPTYYSQHQLGATFSGSPFLAFAKTVARLPLYPCLLFLAIARILLLAIALLLAGLLLVLLAPLRPLPFLQWRLQRALLQLPLRLVFLAFGFHWILEEAADCRRLKILPRKLRPAAPFASFLALPPQTARQPAAFTGLSASRGPSPASLCLSSFTSFVEPLYLQMRLNPIFVGIHADGSLSILSFWGILKYAFSFELAAGCGQFPSLSALLLSLEGRNAGKNPEAVHSARKGSAEPVYTAPHTVNSPLRHLLLLLVQLLPGLVAVNKRGQDLKAFNEYWNQQQLHRGRVKRA